jgi:hypothetical protein
MGTKYSSISVSGYNSSPPADDGSATATNQVKWSIIKTKLGDPLNTFAAAINSALTTFSDFSVRQITASDSTVAGDHMRTVEIASSVDTAVTVSLADAATVGNGYMVRIKNSGTGTTTIGRVTGTDTIEGYDEADSQDLTLSQSQWIVVQVNSSADGYITVGGGSLGTWTTPTFSAGDFTASGSQTWTVAEGDVLTYAYTIIGKMMTVMFAIESTTVGGTPSTQLIIAIPAGKTATKSAYNAIGLISDNSVRTTGVISIGAGDTTMLLNRTDNANWTASTNATTVRGQITFEID